MLEQREKETLVEIERLAYRYEFQASQLRTAVAKCIEQQSTQGLDEMVAFSFNAQQFRPNYGGGNSNLPPGDYTGVIVNSSGETNSDGKGGHLALHLTPIDGPLKGQVHIDRLNLHHTNPKTVEIANEQMSAYCHVLNKFQFNDTAELHNIPFRFSIGWQKGQEPSQEKPNGGYTEVKKIYDINGNEPGKAGTGPAPAAAPAVAPAAAPAVAPAAAPAAGWGAPAPAAAPAQAAPAQAAPAVAPWGGAAAAATPAPAPWGAQ